jgi:hypothetical protein
MENAEGSKAWANSKAAGGKTDKEKMAGLMREKEKMAKQAEAHGTAV